MSDELDNGVVEYPQEPVAEVKQEEAKEVPEVKEQESSKEQNFRVMRERAEAAERKAQEYERYVMQMQQQNQPQKPIEQEEDDFDIKDDDYVEGKQLKKYVKKLGKELKETKKQLQETHQRNTVELAKSRLSNEFKDFYEVVNDTNLKKLEQTKPALYRSLMTVNDTYDAGYTAYEMIKSAGLDVNRYEAQDKKIEENRSKPRSAAVASPQAQESPLSRAGDYDRRILTPERIAQLQKQIEEAKRNR